MTQNQLKAYNNGAWLCAGCARSVDVFEAHFPPGTLSGWQSEAHRILCEAVIYPVYPVNVDWESAISGATNFWNRARDIHPEFYGRSIVGFPHAQLSKIDRLSQDCWNLDSPANPLKLSGLYPNIVALQKRILETLQIVRRTFNVNSTSWWIDDYNVWRPSRNAWSSSGQPDLLSPLWMDFLMSLEELNEFRLGRTNRDQQYLW